VPELDVFISTSVPYYNNACWHRIRSVRAGVRRASSSWLFALESDFRPLHDRSVTVQIYLYVLYYCSERSTHAPRARDSADRRCREKENKFKNKSNSLASTPHGLIDKPLNRQRRRSGFYFDNGAKTKTTRN